MKKGIYVVLIAALVLLCFGAAVGASADVIIDREAFPDGEFREIVSGFDLDGDGSLSAGEIANVKTIDCTGHDYVYNLRGIGVFTSLETLNCRGCYLTSLDLTGCTALKTLDCGWNRLIALNVSGCPALEWVDCSGNGWLRELNVSSSAALCAALRGGRTTSWDGSYTPDNIGNAIFTDFQVSVTGGGYTSEPVIRTRVNAAENEFTLPETLELGQGLRFTVHVPENTTSAIVHLFYMDGDAPQSGGLWSATREQMETPGIFEAWFSHEWMEENPGHYRVAVISRIEENGSEREAITTKDFTVLGTRPDVPNVKVNSTSMNMDEIAVFDISAGTAQAGTVPSGLRCFIIEANGYGYETYLQDRYELTEDGHIIFREGQPGGTQTYRFSVRFGTVWSEYSDPVVIESRSLGQLEAPDWAVVPATLEAGRPFCIDFGFDEKVDHYSVYVTSDGYSNSKSIYGSGNQEVIRYGFDAGSYNVEITAFGKGYENSRIEKTLTVTGSRPAAPEIIPPEGIHYYDDTVWMTLRAKGLEAAGESYEYSEIYQANDGVCYYPVTAARRKGYSVRYVRAKIDGKWTDDFELSYVGTQPADGDDEDTLLNIPEFPGSILRGQDLQFRAEIPEGATDCTFSISYVIEDNEEHHYVEQIVYEYGFKPDGNGNGKIPAQFFTKAGDYDIGIDVWGENAFKYCTKKITVKENSNIPAAPAVTLLTDSTQMFGDVKFRISASGATKACVVIKDSDNKNSVIINPIEISMQNGSCEFVFNAAEYNLYYSQNLMLTACAFNGTVWSGYCEPVAFSFDWPKGALQMPADAIMIDNEEPVSGDTVTVNWKSVIGAEIYKLELDYETILFCDSSAARSYALNTAGLQPGEHFLRLSAYTAGKFSCDDTQRFVLLDPAIQPTIRADRDEINRGEAVHLTIQTVKGDFVFVLVDNEVVSRCLRDLSGTQEATIRLVNGGTHAVTVRTGSSPYEMTSPVSDPVSIRVTLPIDMILPAGLTTLGNEAFMNLKDRTISVPADLTNVAEDAIDKSVMIVAPAKSPAVKWFREHGYTVIEE